MLWPDPAAAIQLRDLPLHVGLGHKDRLILEEFRDRNLWQPDRIWINQVIGNLPTWLGEITDPTRRDWIIATYSKRPDLIAEFGRMIYAVEIKPYASYQALGQATMYAVLAEKKADPPRQFAGWILTDSADPDLRTVLEDRGDPRLTELGHFTLPRPSFPT